MSVLLVTVTKVFILRNIADDTESSIGEPPVYIQLVI